MFKLPALSVLIFIMANVLTAEEGYVVIKEDAADSITSEDSAAQAPKPRAHNRINAEYGFCYLTDDTKDNASQPVKDYNAKLTSGRCLTLSYNHYWPSKQIEFGMGFLFSKYFSDATLENVGFIDTSRFPPETSVTNMTENISIYFFGMLLALHKTLTSQRLDINGDLRLGFMPYYDDMQVFGQTVSMNSPTLGFGGSLGIDYLITDNIGVGVSFNGYFGSVSTLYVVDGTDISLKNPISLNRFDINIGLKIHFDADMPERPNYDGSIWMPPMTPPTFPH
jgi:hypothetical protein